MWIGGLGDDSTDVPAPAPASPSSDALSLAANLVDIIHPYKQGVPVNVSIDSQTQSFLMMGGVLIAGLVILSMVKR
jgi:hypothetical protein